jgi:hypothetical protein
MGLDTIHLLDLLLIYPELDQGHMGKQGQDHGRGRGRSHAFVSWNLLVMRAEVQTALALDDAIDQQAHDCQHR